MKHLQKFNEAKVPKKVKEFDPFEKMDELFFSFIEELSEAGKIARSEQSHSNYRSEEKSEVDSAIKEYGDLLNKVNKKFEKFKSTLEEHYKK